MLDLDFQVSQARSPVRLQIEPRLGFLGLGWIGRQRMEAIAGSSCAEIVAMADPCKAALEEAASVAPEAVQAATLDELFGLDLALDGVVIATPSAMHADQAVAALGAGCAVFCQKPLARTASEARRVVAAARRADRLLGVDYSYRHTRGMEQIRSLIRRGELGRIYAVEMAFHNAYGPGKSWFYDRELSGGGCVMDLGIHLVDLALWCLDFPEVASAGGHLLAQGRPLKERDLAVEDYASVRLELTTGASVQLACSWRLPAGCDAHIEASFYGTGGGASFRNVNGSFYDFTAEHFTPDRRRHLLAGPPDAWGGRAAIQWAQDLGNGSGFDEEIAGAVRVGEVLDLIYGGGTR